MIQSCETCQLGSPKLLLNPHELTPSASFIKNLRLIVNRVLQENQENIEVVEYDQSQVTGGSVSPARPTFATDFVLGTWKESEIA